jgi:hypothetical protein
MQTSDEKMNRREFAAAGTALATASLLRVAASPGGEVSTRPTLSAGAAEVVVTPAAEGTFLVGPMKESTGVNDDLYARVAVLSDGSTRLAIVTIDYLGFDFAFNDLLIAAITKSTGIPADHVMINCSHTHSAPITVPWGRWAKAKDQTYHKFLPERLAKAARQACDRLKPVRLTYAREPTQIGFNRRMLHDDRVVMAPNPSGAVVPWIDVLSMDSLDGERIAALFSYAAHPVIVHNTSRLISADYPGFAVKNLRQSHDGETVFMFAQGCSGNVNAFPLQGGIEAAAAAGRDLGQAVKRALDNGGAAANGSLKSLSCELTLPLADPPAVAELEEIIAGIEDAPKRARREALLAIAKSGRPQTMRFPIRAFAVGDQFCILGLPHEPFAEYHHFVERVSPFEHTMVFGYTNGLHCYVGTEKDYLLGERGGYETSPWGAALMFESRLPLAPSCEKVIQAGILRTLKALKAE